MAESNGKPTQTVQSDAPIQGLIPVTSNTQSANTEPPPVAPVQPQSSTTISAASEKTE